MPASTARYYGFDFFQAKLQMNVASVLTETTFLYANKIDLKPQEKTITFAGDGLEKYIYLVTAIVAEFTQDTIDLVALSAAFLKSKVTAGLPSGLSELTWFGDKVEQGGAAAGLVADAHAIRNIAGVEVAKDIRIWIPLGTLTYAKPPGFQTSAKADSPMLRLSAARTAVDVVGAALPTVPSGGAMYAIAELT